MPLKMSKKIREKLSLKQPPVTEEEIVQCFANKIGGFLIDARETHVTDPPTKWFVSETNYGRKLKVVFILKEGNIIIKPAFDPNSTELRIYKNKAF